MPTAPAQAVKHLPHELIGTGAPLLLLHGFGGSGANWLHAGREELGRDRQLIVPELSSTEPQRLLHQTHARDVIALLDRLGLSRVQAIGMSMGGNTLLHVATMQPARLEAMVLVSATTHFPEQARAIQRATPGAEFLAEDREDLAFTVEQLRTITARTLVVYGDRDPLYPVEIGVELYRAIPDAQLMVVPGGGHGPIFAPHERPNFVQAARRFLAV